jgi:ABC-2 type transport system permease protein
LYLYPEWTDAVYISSYNIFDAEFATLDNFFYLAPLILLSLVPAITMRSFSDEFRGGTYELLETRPLSRWQMCPANTWEAFSW